MAKKTSTKRKPQCKGIPDEELDAILNQPAQLTMEQVINVASVYENYGPTRSILLASLTKSMRELMDCAEKEDAGFLITKTADSGEDLISKMESLLEMIRSATHRLQCAICVREDGLDLLERAKTEDWPPERGREAMLRLVVDNTRG
jgi:hypothetical protein